MHYHHSLVIFFIKACAHSMYTLQLLSWLSISSASQNLSVKCKKNSGLQPNPCCDALCRLLAVINSAFPVTLLFATSTKLKAQSLTQDGDFKATHVKWVWCTMLHSTWSDPMVVIEEFCMQTRALDYKYVQSALHCQLFLSLVKKNIQFFICK